MIQLPTGSTASYLAALDTTAIVVTQPRRLLATNMRGLQRLPHDVGIEWIAWCRSTDDAKWVLRKRNSLLSRYRNGVKVVHDLPEIITAIEAAARSMDIVLTPHERTVERARVLANRLDQVFADFRRSGELLAFNKAYQAHRLAAAEAGKKTQPYFHQFEKLRRTVIRALVDLPPATLCSATLKKRICAEFPWYR